MYCREIQVVKFKDHILQILQDLISMPGFVEKLFIDRGLFMFVLNLIFDRRLLSLVFARRDMQAKNEVSESNELRGRLLNLVLEIDRKIKYAMMASMGSQDDEANGVIKAFIPTDFFAEINDQLRKSQYQPELFDKMTKFLENFDQPRF